MTSAERHEGRYQRRKAKREENKRKRAEDIGSFEEVFSFGNLYKATNKICRNVRWKRSTQSFENHAISRTAKNYKRIQKGWKPQSYKHFVINERGKTREIDAPYIEDRQIHKILTKDIMLPLYQPILISNNGASLENKGIRFSREKLISDLQYHYRKYGFNGHIILLDFKKYFPNADHNALYNRHQKLIYDPRMRDIADAIVELQKGNKGLPLGIEPSQLEMVTYASDLDNFIKCQLSIECFGKYMDDYYIIIPPDKDPNIILNKIKDKAVECKLVINHQKTKVIKFGTPFRYCKIKYIITDTGKIVTRCSPKSVQILRRKIRKFHKLWIEGKISPDDLYMSIDSSFSYIESFYDHNVVLELRRLFYALFGFSCEKRENFILNSN